MKDKELKVINIILLMVLIISITGCSNKKDNKENVGNLQPEEQNEFMKDPEGESNDLKEIPPENDVDIINFTIENQKINFSIVNNTKEQLMYNKSFKLFKKSKTKKELLPKIGFKDVAIKLKPADSVPFEINLTKQFSSLKPGKYILEKEIYKENNEYYTIKKEFEIE